MKHPLLLLVEDDAILALHTRARLEALDYGVETAASGEQAVARATADPLPELILMDIDLGPGINGTEAARRILAAREVPIVFLTMHSEPEWVDLVKGITRYGYVLKDSGEFVLAETVGMALDLFAAQRRARKSERRYRDLFDHSPDIIVVYDHQARFADANATAAANLGIARDSLIGLPLGAFVPDMPDLTVQRIADCLATGATRTYADAIRHSDGRFRHYESVFVPTPPGDDGTPRVQVITHDTTDLVSARTELEELLQRMELAESPDGEVRSILASGRPLRTEEGQVKEIVGINLDITETAQPRRSWGQGQPS